MVKADLPPVAAPPTDPAVPDVPFDRAWRYYTDAGNRAFDVDAFDRAAIAYRSALAEAQRLFRQTERVDQDHSRHVAPMLVVSAGNAARNAMARGDLVDADAVLLEVATAYLHVLSTAGVADEIRQACIRHLPHLLLDLTDAIYADAPCAAMRQRMAMELTDVARSIALGPAN